MKKRITAFFLASVMVFQTGCSATVAMDENGKVTVDGVPIEELAEQFGVLGGDKQEEQTGEDKQEVSPEDEETVKKAQGGKPWIDSDIKSNISEDMMTDPRDDFHLYANKEWLLENEIPAGYSQWSHYSERGLEVKKQCMELLKDESIEGHDAKLLRTYNSLILDWDAREKLGVSEIEDTYKRLLGIESIDDVNDLYEEKEMLNTIDTFFGYEAATGFNDPDLYVIGVATPELLLDDSAEYKDRTEYGDMLYGFGKDAFVYMAKRMGMTEDDAVKYFEDAIDFEAKLAEGIYTTKETKQDDYISKINNEMTYEDLTDHCKNFPIGRILDIDGYSYDGSYLVIRPDYFNLLDDLYTDENIDGIKACLIVNYLLGYKGIIDKDSYDHSNEIRNKYFGTSGSV
ncbi:MAG: hypothetical protein K6E88_09725, partial [Lachnospiraceae bacterium]|nr:hypothetical protein [Lachnospiraceae bacterium]